MSIQPISGTVRRYVLDALYIVYFMVCTVQVVMLRHGESTWNQENRFCGWFDAGLSEKGQEYPAKEIENGFYTVKKKEIFHVIIYGIHLYLSYMFSNL